MWGWTGSDLDFLDLPAPRALHMVYVKCIENLNRDERDDLDSNLRIDYEELRELGKPKKRQRVSAEILKTGEVG